MNTGLRFLWIVAVTSRAKQMLVRTVWVTSDWAANLLDRMREEVFPDRLIQQAAVGIPRRRPTRGDGGMGTARIAPDIGC